MEIYGFDWDIGNLGKCISHGLSIAEVESIFTHEPHVMVNTRHDTREERFHAIGVTAKGRHAFVVFTFRVRRNEILIRPISARYMHKKEIEYYEKQIKK